MAGNAGPRMFLDDVSESLTPRCPEPNAPSCASPPDVLGSPVCGRDLIPIPRPACGVDMRSGQAGAMLGESRRGRWVEVVHAGPI